MSTTPVSNVKFTKEQYKKEKNIDIYVTNKKEVGTVIYVENDVNAFICNMGDSDLEYIITDELFKLPQNHGLKSKKYYVVINDNPCADESNTKKFFMCDLGTTISSSLHPVNVSESEIKAKFAFPTLRNRAALPAVSPTVDPPVEPKKMLSTFLFTNTINVSVYKIDNITSNPNVKLLINASLNLTTIMKNQIDNQLEILKSLSKDKDTISKHMYTLYTWWVDNIFNNLEIPTPNNEANKNKQTKRINKLNIINTQFATVIYRIITKEQINKIIKQKNINNILAYPFANFSEFYNRIYNSENYLKINFVYLEIINNLFYILVLQSNPDFNNLNNISKLNKDNIKTHIQYKISNTESYDNFYLVGIDTAIIDEYNAMTDKPDLVFGNKQTVNVIKQEFKFTGGSRKTKKRKAKLSKQSRKTKKQSRK